MERSGDLIQVLCKVIIIENAVQILESGYANLIVKVCLESLEVVVLNYVNDGVCIFLNGFLVISQLHKAGTVLLHKGIIPII